MLDFHMAVLGLLVILLIVIALCVFVPRLLARPGWDGRRDPALIERHQKSVLAIIGAASLIVPFSWSLIKDNQATVVAHAQTDHAQYQEAVRMLGRSEATSTAVRISAIRSLECLATPAGKAFALPVFEVLLAFVRENASAARCAAGPNELPRVTADVQAALLVLGSTRMSQLEKRPALELGDLCLVGASFKGLALAYADFRRSWLGGADFRQAALYSSRFDQARAGGRRTFGEGRGGWEALIKSEPEEKYRYIVNFSGADLSGARFTRAMLDGALFGGTEAGSAPGVVPATKLACVDMSGAELDGAVFASAEQLQTVKLAGATARVELRYGVDTEVARPSREETEVDRYLGRAARNDNKARDPNADAWDRSCGGGSGMAAVAVTPAS